MLEAPTVLAPPSGARVASDLIYRVDGERVLRLDAYRPAHGEGPWPVVFLVNGDAPEAVIGTAKDWGVYRSYGEHLAARGMVGVPFNHRSGAGGRTAEVAADVRAAIDFVRESAAGLGVDPMRVGVWVFSAGGPFGIAPLLQRRPDWLRCAAGFYTIWDLEPYRGRIQSLTDEAIRRWSPVTALESPAPDLPPLLIARAGRDSAQILEGTETFLRRARERGVDVALLDHLDGQHGFDIQDDNERSREIIAAALEFFESHLRA